MSRSRRTLLLFNLPKIAVAAGIGLMMLLLSCYTLQAQSTQEIDLSEFEYSISISGGTLNANEVATVTLTLGTSAEQLQDVVGIRLELSLSNNANLPPSSLAVNAEYSWAIDPASFSKSVSVNVDAHTMSLTVLRNSGSADGFGFAFSFPLVACCNGVNANSLIVSDGGVVIIENIDMRLANPAAGNGFPVDDSVLVEDFPKEPQPVDAFERVLPSHLQSQGMRMYPNPCHAYIQMPLIGNATATLRFIALDGRVFEVPVRNEGGIGISDIEPLPRGIYQAELLQEGRLTLRQKLLLE